MNICQMATGLLAATNSFLFISLIVHLIWGNISTFDVFKDLGASNMESKDFIAITISLVALLLSGLAFYFSHFYRPIKGMLTLCSLKFHSKNSELCMKLRYTVSNVGKQSFSVVDAKLLLGKKPPLIKTHDTFVLNNNKVPVFVIEPGEIQNIEFIYPIEHYPPPSVEALDQKRMVTFLSVISADGKRFEFIHDFTALAGKPSSQGHWGSVLLKKCS
ncbi:TPA: hypothetical protein RQL27_004264 [Vibrio vulnificus]|uniref:hypothetical protein n=1 Tax=Vibrio vulnificus TaxID=672 RepID=UPI001CCE4E2C|nr:hypothetical protein [Vibrio vulnificus]MCA0778821.1 hypothetical protein [Vibrio vulnificus]HDY8234389.1 hypothetical protein [Vibrio vulnificus]